MPLAIQWFYRVLASAPFFVLRRDSAGKNVEEATLSTNSLTDPILREPSPFEEAIMLKMIMYSFLYGEPVVDMALREN